MSLKWLPRAAAYEARLVMIALFQILGWTFSVGALLITAANYPIASKSGVGAIFALVIVGAAFCAIGIGVALAAKWFGRLYRKHTASHHSQPK